MSTPAPGWYPDPDPANPGGIRYWDGTQWTSEVSSRPGPVPPPTVPTMAQTGPGYGYVAPAPPLAAGATRRLGPAGQILAGWWRRALGLLLDGLIVGIPTGILTALVAGSVIASGQTIIDEQAWEDFVARVEAGETQFVLQDFTDIIGDGFAPVFWTSIIVWLVLSVLNGVVLVARSGQTLGDRVVGVRKVTADRRAPSLLVAFGRWLVPNVVGNIGTIGGFALMLDYLWAAWDPQSQTVHDKLFKTYVERTDSAGPLPPTR